MKYSLPWGKNPGCLATLESLPKCPHCCGFATSGMTVSSQLLKDCPCSIMPCSSCKADGNLVLLWQTHFAAQLKPSHGVYFTCGDKAYLSLPSFWSGTCSLGYVMPHIDLAWSNTSLPLFNMHQPEDTSCGNTYPSFPGVRTDHWFDRSCHGGNFFTSISASFYRHCCIHRKKRRGPSNTYNPS